MTDIQDYCRNAEDCVRQAQSEDTDGGRDILLNVALAWLRLADQTDAQNRRDDDNATAEPSSEQPAAPVPALAS